MENTFKENHLLKISRKLTPQQIHIFNELVSVAIKDLENPNKENCKIWDSYVNQLDDSVKLAIICRAGDQAVELFNEINK